MARKSAREAAMILLYQNNFLKECNLTIPDDMMDEFNISDKDMTYIQDVFNGFQKHQETIDSIIKDKSKGWKFERLSKIDLSILRLALYEIIYRNDIPNSVSINEAVELAKKYGNEKSGPFVNGILGAYLKSFDSKTE